MLRVKLQGCSQHFNVLRSKAELLSLINIANCKQGRKRIHHFGEVYRNRETSQLDTQRYVFHLEARQADMSRREECQTYH